MTISQEARLKRLENNAPPKAASVFVLRAIFRPSKSGAQYTGRLIAKCPGNPAKLIENKEGETEDEFLARLLSYSNEGETIDDFLGTERED